MVGGSGETRKKRKVEDGYGDFGTEEQWVVLRQLPVAAIVGFLGFE